MGIQLWRHLRGLLFRTKPRLAFPSLRTDAPRHGFRSAGGEGAGDTEGNRMLLPGATVATLLMLGGLHVRRLYEDNKLEQARQQGIELEFAPDVKAAFLQVLPLRFLSRAFGLLTSMELPVWMRPYVYKGYCRAFNANLDEVAEDLRNYSSLRHFFGRQLKEGCRPLELDSFSLISPVDGVILRCGEVKGKGLAIEQVKGHTYSVKSLLGADPRDISSSVAEDTAIHARNPDAKLCNDGIFYCVLYLGPGDYHRIHSPADWRIQCRRHFSGHLFPVNERATRTIRDLYVGNERVVLEGNWSQGFMALAAVGALNVGSIELKIEPELKTNCAFTSNIPSIKQYDKGPGYFLQKGDELATFNLGSTVVLIFQAPASMPEQETGNLNNSQHGSSGFTFAVKRGERVKMGETLGKWQS